MYMMDDKKWKWWRNDGDHDHLQDNFDNNSEYGHQQYDQEKDVEPG